MPASPPVGSRLLRRAMTCVTFSTVAAAKPQKTPITVGQAAPSTKRDEKSEEGDDAEDDQG